jgi:hypothetical protein
MSQDREAGLTGAEAKLREHVRRMAATSPVELDSYVDQIGRFFAPAPLPPGKPQVMRIVLPQADCYKKSQLLAEGDPSLEYVEGWALAPDGVPTQHAWCVDAEGRVVDAEWPTPESLTYFGVVIPRAFGYAWRGVLSPGQALAIEEREKRGADK